MSETGTCQHDGCDEPGLYGGLCEAHDAAAFAMGPAATEDVGRSAGPGDICENCGKTYRSHAIAGAARICRKQSFFKPTPPSGAEPAPPDTQARERCVSHRQGHDSCNGCPHFMAGGKKCLAPPEALTLEQRARAYWPRNPHDRALAVELAREAIDAVIAEVNGINTLPEGRHDPHRLGMGHCKQRILDILKRHRGG